MARAQPIFRDVRLNESGQRSWGNVSGGINFFRQVGVTFQAASPSRTFDATPSFERAKQFGLLFSEVGAVLFVFLASVLQDVAIRN